MKNTFKAIAIVGGGCVALGAILGLFALLVMLTNEHPKVVALMVVGLVAATVVTMVKNELDAADRRRQHVPVQCPVPGAAAAENTAESDVAAADDTHTEA